MTNGTQAGKEYQDQRMMPEVIENVDKPAIVDWSETFNNKELRNDSERLKKTNGC